MSTKGLDQELTLSARSNIIKKSFRGNRHALLLSSTMNSGLISSSQERSPSIYTFVIPGRLVSAFLPFSAPQSIHVLAIICMHLLKTCSRFIWFQSAISIHSTAKLMITRSKIHGHSTQSPNADQLLFCNKRFLDITLFPIHEVTWK